MRLLASSAFLACGGLLAPSIASGQVFQNIQQVPAPNIPASVVSADINRDGFADVVVPQFGAALFDVRFGTLAGTLTSPVTYSSPGTPNSIALVDVNGDSWLDAIVDDQGVPSTVRLGSFGGYGAPINTPIVAGFPVSVVSADFNLDGYPDFAIADGNTFAVRVAYGVGNGNFVSPASYPCLVNTGALAVGDLNGDAYPDLAVGTAGTTQALVLLKATNLGTFVVSQVPTPGVEPRSLAMGDFNEDGKLDVLASNDILDTNTAHVFLGNGALTFPSSTTIPAGGFVATVVAGDFDFDGHLDAAMTAGALKVARGSGIGTFVAPTSTFLPPFASALAHADLDSDGRLDLLATSAGVNQLLTVFRNVTAIPNNTSSFGSGTQGCFGRLGIIARGVPFISNGSFGFVCTNAPRRSLGICFIGNVGETSLSDPFSIGAWLHVNLILSTEVYTADFVSDTAGTAVAAVPLPYLGSLVGLTYYAQGLWIENAMDGLACSTSIYDIVTSKGEMFTIQPLINP
ncbi:MAG: VCBS repeat-containing protein [Planctomycetes bacterium]|nr:VCBS repeat-containing protein [Planctomycetota bacterium]